MKRRGFVKAGLSSTALFAFSGLTLIPNTAREASAATFNFNFTANAVFKNLIDGNSIYTWQFSDLTNGGPGALSSGIVMQAGDLVNVSLTNNLDRNINFSIPTVLTNTTPCLPGNTQLYSFVAPAAGSYRYQDELNGPLGLALGLAGPLIVMPANGSNQLYAGGPIFDQQFTLFLNEMDSRLNAAIAIGSTFDLANYEPNYFFVNGLSAPDTKTDPDTHITMRLNQNIALRFINAGLIYSPMHFHGFHVNVISRNRVLETAVIDKDTVLVNIDESVDVILPVTQTGTFPLHTHFVPGVTSNGVYGQGALIYMDAT